MTPPDRLRPPPPRPAPLTPERAELADAVKKAEKACNDAENTAKAEKETLNNEIKLWNETCLQYRLDYIADNGIDGVYFSGHVTFPEILSYYKLADVFLCESEHEGFCVPLLEAMTFDVPIIAYASTAIPYTMGESGVLFTEKDHKIVAELIDTVVTNSSLKDKIIKKQRERLDYFNIKKTKTLFEELIKPWLD